MTLLIFLALAAAGLPAPHDSFHNVESRCEAPILLPEPTGPHQVGTSTFAFIDPDRPETLTEDPYDRRQVLFQLWYPAMRDRDTDPAVYMPDLEALRVGFMADRRDMPQKIARDLAAYACVVTHAFPDIAVSDLAPTYPVIVFSPGGNMSRHWHTAQAQEFASQGYVVVVLGHAHSGLDVYPKGGMLMSSQAWRTPEDATEAQERQVDDRLSDVLAADASFALSRLLEITDGTLEHPLNGRIDTSRVAIVGHSRGGKTVARACSTDARFRACVSYDNLAPERERQSGLRQPQLTLRTAWQPWRVEILHEYMEKNPAIGIDVELEGAGHFTFSDLQIVDPGNYEHELDPETGLHRANRLTLSFLDAVLDGREPDLAGLESTEGTKVWSNQGD